jgi:hypothetical protein
MILLDKAASAPLYDAPNISSRLTAEPAPATHFTPDKIDFALRQNSRRVLRVRLNLHLHFCPRISISNTYFTPDTIDSFQASLFASG